MAYEDLGVIYEKMGDLKKAQGAYSQAATIRGPEQTRAELQVARIMAAQGDKAGAINAYQSFLTVTSVLAGSPDRHRGVGGTWRDSGGRQRRDGATDAARKT